VPDSPDVVVACDSDPLEAVEDAPDSPAALGASLAGARTFGDVDFDLRAFLCALELAALALCPWNPWAASSARSPVKVRLPAIIQRRPRRSRRRAASRVLTPEALRVWARWARMMLASVRSVGKGSLTGV